jgi:putative transcriptional regulator
MKKTNDELETRDAQRDIGSELLSSVREMMADKRAREHEVETSDAATARLKIGLSQAEFATLLGVSKRTLQDWEQGRREPSGAAKSLIELAMKRPDVLVEVFGKVA